MTIERHVAVVQMLASNEHASTREADVRDGGSGAVRQCGFEARIGPSVDIMERLREAWKWGVFRRVF